MQRLIDKGGNTHNYRSQNLLFRSRCSRPQFQTIKPAKRRAHRLSNTHNDTHVITAENVEETLDSTPPPIKFTPFCMNNELRRRMVDHRRCYDLDNNKTLIVQAITKEWIENTSDLLSDAFADSMGYISIYKRFLKQSISRYLQTHMLLPPKTVILIAVIMDTTEYYASLREASVPMKDDFETNVDNGDGMASSQFIANTTNLDNSNDNADVRNSETIDASNTLSIKVTPQNSTLVGALEISFTESTRSKYLTLNPPSDRPYLCNMAIDEKYRRCGYGMKLLEASEDLITKVGENSVYLHLRFQDVPAAGLYNRAGYTSVGEDVFLMQLIGMDRRYLMKKNL